MSITVWLFLVSRNPYLDYRTVVAPDFICEAKSGNLLARVTTGDLTDPGKGFIRQIFGSKVGDFTVIYRILKATQKDLNSQEGDKILKDQFGREILLIEGVVIREIKSKENVLISQKNIEEIHQKLTEAYTEFWEHRDPHPAIPSHKLSLSMDSSSTPLQLEEIERFQVDPKPPIPPPSPSASLSLKSSIRPYSLAFIFTIIMAAAIFTLRYINPSQVYDCTTTEDKKITFDSKKDIDDLLQKLKIIQKDYPNATIFLNGYLILESNKKWQNLTKREELSELVNYTVNLDGDILKLQDHPLDLAIAQLSNQKVGDISKLQNYLPNQGGFEYIPINAITIKAKIINRKNKKECQSNS